MDLILINHRLISGLAFCINADPKLVLNAFILSKTKFMDIINKNCTEQDLEERHVLFMEHGGAAYLPKMFGKMM